MVKLRRREGKLISCLAGRWLVVNATSLASSNLLLLVGENLSIVSARPLLPHCKEFRVNGLPLLALVTWGDFDLMSMEGTARVAVTKHKQRHKFTPIPL